MRANDTPNRVHHRKASGPPTYKPGDTWRPSEWVLAAADDYVAAWVAKNGRSFVVTQASLILDLRVLFGID